MTNLIALISKIFRPRSLPETARIGIMGEDTAARFLKSQSHKILARNYRSGRNEIDIISRDPHGVIVFTEVKTRTVRAVVGGYYAGAQRGKAARVRTCAKTYLAKMRPRPKTWRFDIIEVLHDPDRPDAAPIVRHYPNSF